MTTARLCLDCPSMITAKYARYCPNCRWRHRLKKRLYMTLTPEEIHQKAQIEKYLSVEEVARYYRVQKSTVYNLITKGGLRSVKVGKYLRIPSGEAMALGSLNAIILQ